MNNQLHLLLHLTTEDIRVTGIQHGHGRAAKQFAARGTKFNLYKY